MKANIKKRTLYLTLTVLMLVGLVFAPLLTVQAAVDPDAMPTEGQLHIHKVVYDQPAEGDPDPIINGDGTEISSLPGATPKENVKFNVIRILNEADVAENPSQKSSKEYWDQHHQDPAYSAVSGKTNSEGVYDTGILPAGRYLIFEVSDEEELPTTAMPVVLTIPMTTTDGTGWNSDVHIYTKDISVLGAARLYKHEGEIGKSKAMAGAKFDLYAVSGKEGEHDKAIETNIVTDDTGYTPVVSNLVKGDYYFIETSAPSGYVLNTTKHTFKITDTDHAYTPGGDIEPTKLISVGAPEDSRSVPNYKAPTITKTLTTNSTADVGEKNTWEITSDIPADIEHYKQYVITDEIDTKLDYVGNVTVKIGGTALNPAAYQIKTPQSNRGTFAVTLINSDFGGYLRAVTPGSKLVVTFDTKINQTATPGVNIPNSAKLTYNNGYVTNTATVPQVPFVATGARKFLKVNTSEQPLAGAKFVIYKTKDDQRLYLQQDSEKSAKWVENKIDATEFTSAADGTFQAFGLSYGDYYLKETKAPMGYNLLPKDVEFMIDAKSNEDENVITVQNSNRPTIPVTGGIGTLIFFIAGGIIMTIVVVTSRKKKKSESEAK